MNIADMTPEERIATAKNLIDQIIKAYGVRLDLRIQQNARREYLPETMTAHIVALPDWTPPQVDAPESETVEHEPTPAAANGVNDD